MARLSMLSMIGFVTPHRGYSNCGTSNKSLTPDPMSSFFFVLFCILSGCVIAGTVASYFEEKARKRAKSIKLTRDPL
jgi:hypothetical protein